MESIQQKPCGRCHESKPFSEYCKNKTRFDGLQLWCKACGREKAKEYYHKHLEKSREKSRKARRVWYAKHPELVRQQRRAAYAANPLPEYRRSKDWQKRNPDRVRQNRRARKLRKKQAIGSFTFVEWTDLCNKYGNKCLACGKEKKLTADHVVPLSRGGSNAIENIQPLCAYANCKKHTSTIDYRMMTRIYPTLPPEVV